MHVLFLYFYIQITFVFLKHLLHFKNTNDWIIITRMLNVIFNLLISIFILYIFDLWCLNSCVGFKTILVFLFNCNRNSRILIIWYMTDVYYRDIPKNMQWLKLCISQQVALPSPCIQKWELAKECLIFGKQLPSEEWWNGTRTGPLSHRLAFSLVHA